MAKAILLCGRIASGKTTYAQKLKIDTSAVILSADDLMLTLFDACLGERHNDMVARISRYFCSLSEDILAKGLDAVFDFGYWTKQERAEIKQYFTEKALPFELHYIRAPEETRLNRLKARNERLKDSAKREYIIEGELLKKLDARFEEPSPDEVDIYVDNN